MNNFCITYRLCKNQLFKENKIEDDSDKCFLNEDIKSENKVNLIGQYLEQIKEKSLNVYV